MYVPDGKTEEWLSEQPYCNPVSAEDLSGLPPTTGIVGGADILRDEGVAYYRAVAAAGNKIEWR